MSGVTAAAAARVCKIMNSSGKEATPAQSSVSIIDTTVATLALKNTIRSTGTIIYGTIYMPPSIKWSKPMASRKKSVMQMTTKSIERWSSHTSGA